MFIKFYKELAAGRWFELSLMEQLGNIGSEVARAGRLQGTDEARFQNAVERTLELFDLTIADIRWRGRLGEIVRAREVFCDAVYGGKLYKSFFVDLDRYFLPFAYAARNILYK